MPLRYLRSAICADRGVVGALRYVQQDRRVIPPDAVRQVPPLQVCVAHGIVAWELGRATDSDLGTEHSRQVLLSDDYGKLWFELWTLGAGGAGRGGKKMVKFPQRCLA